jgi:hypothetical protein
MKVKRQLQLLYFQVDKDLICMNLISTFHIMVIIYQSLIYKYMGKFEPPCNLKHILYPIFLYNFKKKIMLNLQ